MCSSPAWRRTCSTARSTSASPRLRALVRDGAAVADAREDEPVLDAVDARLVLVQPGDRPDRPGHEDEAVGEPARQRRERRARGTSRRRRRTGCRCRATGGRRASRSAPRPRAHPRDTPRRRSAIRRRASSRCTPRIRRPRARAARRGSGRSPSPPCSTTCGRGSSRVARGSTSGRGRSSSSVIRADTGAL